MGTVTTTVHQRRLGRQLRLLNEHGNGQVGQLECEIIRGQDPRTTIAPDRDLEPRGRGIQGPASRAWFIMSSPTPEFGGRLIKAVGPGDQVLDTACCQQRPTRLGPTDAEILGGCDNSASAELLGSRRVRTQANLRGACDGRDGRPAFIQALRLVQVGNSSSVTMCVTSSP